MRTARVAGVCVLRNAIDLIPYLCGHYWRIGCDLLCFVDDGSSDGSAALLRRLAARTGRVRVIRVDRPVFQQRQHCNAAIAALMDEGFTVIFPFDADEFWHLSPDEVRAIAADPRERRMFGHWTNFVQYRACRRARMWGPLLVDHAFDHGIRADLDAIRARVAPFVAMVTRKVAFVADGAQSVGPGQHDVVRTEVHTDPRAFEIFHLPLRARDALVARGLDFEPRRAPLRNDADESWQSRMHQEFVETGQVDQAWAANAVDRHGWLDVFGVRMRARRDRRLRWLMARALVHYWRTTQGKARGSAPRSGSEACFGGDRGGKAPGLSR